MTYYNRCWRCWGEGHLYGNATLVRVTCSLCYGEGYVWVRA